MNEEKKWNRQEKFINDIFTYHVARLIYIMNHNEDHELKSVKKYR